LCNQKQSTAIQAHMEKELQKRLRLLKDEFLPSKEYVRRAGFGHYREVNAPVGHVKSPWGDWESTLTSGLSQ
jgi:hypothetical protein